MRCRAANGQQIPSVPELIEKVRRWNHQADKLAYPVNREEAARMTEALDGVIEKVFACPNCGWIESRRAG
jgi:recombinational DNA repair protein RecR